MAYIAPPASLADIGKGAGSKVLFLADEPADHGFERIGIGRAGEQVFAFPRSLVGGRVFEGPSPGELGGPGLRMPCQGFVPSERHHAQPLPFGVVGVEQAAPEIALVISAAAVPDLTLAQRTAIAGAGGREAGGGQQNGCDPVMHGVKA